MNLTSFSEIELQYLVERLLARYAHCIDADELEAWPALFTADCLYKVIARENVERNLPVAAIFCDSQRMLTDRIVSARHANVYEKHTYRHLISSTVVAPLTDDRVRATSNYAVYRTRTNGATELYNTGIYHDEIVAQNERWLFQKKIVVFDTHRIDSLLVTPL